MAAACFLMAKMAHVVRLGRRALLWQCSCNIHLGGDILGQIPR
eukprot:CAMPEP_0194738006 /NCGR_PEP_ID=MMETSP0296-20130528/83359_1 /TAXON_ID=39354 /ORGANISM="Heterosigma akashiwo, Strain CCMP2393" /LENGTH=42 /DNA_ID= /DNA_START= /DNA_END= /DNA_ORIENTATION=